MNRLALATVATLMAFPAHAQMVEARAPESVVRALEGAGYTATLGTDKVGDPMVSSNIGDTRFQVLFYNCTDHTACATVQFHVAYDLSTPVTLEQLNEWNRGQRFGRAFLDKENDPTLEMDVDLDDGGMSTMLFRDNLEFWASVVGKFEKHIGYSK